MSKPKKERFKFNSGTSFRTVTVYAHSEKEALVLANAELDRRASVSPKKNRPASWGLRRVKLRPY